MMGGALPLLTSALGIVVRWIEPRLRHGMWAGSIDPCNPPIFRLLNFFLCESEIDRSRSLVYKYLPMSGFARPAPSVQQQIA